MARSVQPALLRRRDEPYEQQVGPQQLWVASPPGFVARTNALMNLPSTCGAIDSRG